jgi:hypothetical protein
MYFSHAKKSFLGVFWTQLTSTLSVDAMQQKEVGNLEKLSKKMEISFLSSR